MYQRDDGIVEFDGDVCIGCKACMQACPYDAIYIDPDSGTAAKCHYCSHRTDIGLEPACVVVCPEHAIVAGDMDDPESEISRVLAKEQVSVRKPEQGTAPKLFYIEGNDIALTPTATERSPESFMWADVLPMTGEKGDRAPQKRSEGTKKSESGQQLRAGQPQAVPQNGPIQMGEGRMAEHMVQVGYNAQHQVPWHWPVPAYLVTKAIAGGLFMLWAFFQATGVVELSNKLSTAVSGIVVLMLAVTTALLVYDLERPERFLRILLRPQWRSWLTRGAFLLVAYSIVATIWLSLEAGALMGLLPEATATGARGYLLLGGSPLALGATIYTAFLFGQAEGRDLWQSALLPIHLVIQAWMAGSAALVVLLLPLDNSSELSKWAIMAFLVALAVDLLVTLLGEFGMSHSSEVAARAAHEITHGKYKNQFWWGAIVAGHVLPFVLTIFTPLAAPAALLSLAGLYFFENAFVMAPQEIQNS